MNTRKKIIYTLRSADKDSVERLMEEAAKKEEIFAKIMERSGKDGEYTDVAEGTEHYSRRRGIIQTASAAAASVLLVAGIGGAVHFLRSGRGDADNNMGDSNVTADVTINTSYSADEQSSYNIEVTTAGVTSDNTDVTTVAGTDTVTGTADGTTTEAAEKTTETTTTTEVTTAAGEQTDKNAAGEQLREKCISAVYGYERFSADFTLSEVSEAGSLYLRREGTIKIDNPSMTGELSYKHYVSDGRLQRTERYYCLNDKCVNAIDYGDRGLLARITDMSSELEAGGIKDRVFFKEYSGLNQFTRENMKDSQWEVTGERYENGRKIVSAVINYTGNGSGTSFTADFDDETSVCLAYDKYLDGVLTESFRTSGHRFGDEAGAPLTEHEVKMFLENNGYDSNMASGFSDYGIDDLN